MLNRVLGAAAWSAWIAVLSCGPLSVVMDPQPGGLPPYFAYSMLALLATVWVWGVKTALTGEA